MTWFPPGQEVGLMWVFICFILCPGFPRDVGRKAEAHVGASQLRF